ncbi:MAG: alpha-E domain-containing protein, partial [Verrucomicrobia bacterium]|nr:alpha-E domain-containing protein [Verrucomicrobiota bacterium]
SNPRALAFQLARIDDHTAGVPDGANPEGVARLREHARQLRAQLDGFQPAPVPDGATTAEPERIASCLREQAARLGAFSDLLTQVCFSHVTPQVS